MPRTLLCTTGTSIAAGCLALGPYQRRATAWTDSSDDLATQIRERLAGLDLGTPRGRTMSSAELNVLGRLSLDPADEVVLFATDTADGRCCAEAVRSVLAGPAFGLSPGNVRIERVAGLQVHDADRLRREGLVNLSRRLIHYLDDPQRRYSGGCVVCPNGGFKGVVPFMTTLGMIFRAPTVYVFEFAEALIQLPPLPLSLATDLFDRALPALRWARTQHVFELESFYRMIPGFADDERELFNGFLEIDAADAGQVALAALSPLTEVLVQRAGGPDAALELSRQAHADLALLDGPARKTVLDHLAKLASPLWRSLQCDRKSGSDLEFFPRGHNPWRFAGYPEGDRFHLCWFARHDQYERLISAPDRQRGAYPASTFQALNLTCEGAALPGANADAAFSWLDLRVQRDAERSRADALENERVRARQSIVLERARLTSEIDELRRERDAALAELDAVHASAALVADDAPDAAENARAGSNRPRHAPATPARSALAAWRGRIVLARVVEERRRIRVFEMAEAPGENPAVLMPIAETATPRADGLYSLLIIGHDGRNLQARPAHDDPP